MKYLTGDVQRFRLTHEAEVASSDKTEPKSTSHSLNYKPKIGTAADYFHSLTEVTII